jgi:hypothetical protein
MNWVYNEAVSIIPPKEAFGFVYKIIYEDNSAYIGKKQLYIETKLPALKSGIQRPGSTRIGKNKNGKRVYYDIVQKESDWYTYTGSVDIDLPIRHKVILEWAPTKRSLTYLEVKHLFQHNVLESDQYHNQNIGGLYFKGNLL